MYSLLLLSAVLALTQPMLHVSQTPAPGPESSSSAEDEQLDPQIRTWIQSNVVPGEYTPASVLTNLGFFLILVDPNQHSGGYVRAWKRIEAWKPMVSKGESFMSLRSLVEFDCKDHRQRTLVLDGFAHNNLQDQTLHAVIKEPYWEADPPGHPGEQNERIACGIRNRS